MPLPSIESLTAYTEEYQTFLVDGLCRILEALVDFNGFSMESINGIVSLTSSANSEDVRGEKVDELPNPAWEVRCGCDEVNPKNCMSLEGQRMKDTR
ncbi:hypothetical protein FEM48_Zijuj05G0093800 [Ziziphus jujuba var. spinosa]|uniref:Uncharacterized protein n=1 Tax=Ziziphus jujuba var. spinosa TaxID=714518 RepID=A0A978VE53_ZIZJJ|nr:hypothetical protein FEM48_Zijuj05G0093800 [Ziziphus jujuba var. spinosa]